MSVRIPVCKQQKPIWTNLTKKVIYFKDIGELTNSMRHKHMPGHQEEPEPLAHTQMTSDLGEANRTRC